LSISIPKKTFSSPTTWILFLLLITLDLLTKFFWQKLELSTICNTGISFGVEFNSIFFWFIWLVLTLGLTFFYFKRLSALNFSFWEKFAWILIFAGIFSNGLDRAIHNCVQDFIPFLGNIFFFNLADVYLFTGFFFLALKQIIRHR